MSKLTKYLIGALLIAGGLIYAQGCQIQQLKNKQKHLENNVKALADSVRITETKNGELEYNRLTLITNNEELKKLNSSLAEEVKNTKGKVVFIQGSKVVIKDTIKVPVEIIKNDSSGFVVKTKIDTTYSPGNYRKMEHEVRVTPEDTSSTFSEELGISLVTGLKKTTKGDYEILFRSNFPKLRITSLEGAYIPKNQIKQDFKPRRVTIGAHVGYSPLAYDLSEKRLKIRNQITASAGINIRLF